MGNVHAAHTDDDTSNDLELFISLSCEIYKRPIGRISERVVQKNSCNENNVYICSKESFGTFTYQYFGMSIFHYRSH